MDPRTFRWCRQELAEGCRKQDDHVHVIIGTPGGESFTPLCKSASLRLFFHDLDPEAIRRSWAGINDKAKAQELIDHCMNEEHAGHIAMFVRATDPAPVIVNCEAGVSRSPAVVLALRRKYGGDTEECFKTACPNIHVASTLGRVLGVGPFQEPDYKGIIIVPFVQDKP